MDASARAEQRHPTGAQWDEGTSHNRTEAEHQERMSPISFSRRAPTFHRSEIRITGIEAGIGQFRISLNRSGQETRCARCGIREKSRAPIRAGLPTPPTAFGTLEASVGMTYERMVPPSDESSLYVVVSLFSAVDDQPRETVIHIKNGEHLFRDLRWAVFRLRGLRYFVSLKSVRSFRLYKCLIPTGAHKHLELDKRASSDLKQSLAAYKSRWVPKRVNSGWATWIRECLNQNSTDILTDGAYSLEIVLGWSATRISLAVLVPVILSLAIGCWFNSRDWTDLATIQTAWGVASYIATAGGLVAALLAIVSGLSDT